MEETRKTTLSSTFRQIAQFQRLLKSRLRKKNWMRGDYDSEAYTALNYMPGIVLNGSHIITDLILMEIL